MHNHSNLQYTWGSEYNNRKKRLPHTNIDMVQLYTAGKEYFVVLESTRIFSKIGKFEHILWNIKHTIWY